MSVLKTCIHTHPYTTATYEPMQRLNIDSMGPFQADENDNTYIIVVIDCFTRWVELYPAKDATAQSAATALLDHAGRYGVPHQILSDNGPQYVNNIISELIKLIGIEHVTTIAYSHEENAIVERANKEVLRHLRAMIFDKNVVHRWSTCKPFIQRIINSSVETSIGAAPAALLFGNAINLDRGILLPFSDESADEAPLSEWAAQMLEAQQAVLQAAQKSQQLKDTRHIEGFDPRRTEYPDGTYVLVEYPNNAIKKGPQNKLNLYLKGPLRVLSHRGASYKLQNLVTNKEETHHITQLHPFLYDGENINPIDVANRDAFATPVESIVGHTPICNNYKTVKRSDLKFQVRWKDLSEEHDRILPYKELRNNPALHRYLSEQGMKSFIPPEHKHNEA